jgi:hypothetical protein
VHLLVKQSVKSTFIFLSDVVGNVKKFSFFHKVLSVNFVKMKSISNFSHSWWQFPQSLTEWSSISENCDPTICYAQSVVCETGVCYDKNWPCIILYEIIFLFFNGDISLLFECLCGARDRL